MITYKAKLKYDGTDFHGFQIQPNLRTVQGEIQRALYKISKGEYIPVEPSGRTDAGVHALDQVISFQYNNYIEPQGMLRALNSLLPIDMEFFAVEVVENEFHARYSTIAKTYEYRVDRGRFVNPFKRNYTGHFPYPLDITRIKTAIVDLLGEHDFTSLVASGGVIENKVRIIYEAEVIEDEINNEIIFRFTGNGFLYNMVRIMVGLLLEIGTGKKPVDFIPKLLAAKDRQLARVTAPASGLYLKRVYYPEDQNLIDLINNK